MAKCFIVSSVLGMALNTCNPQEAEVESFGGNLGCIVQLLMNKGNHLEISFVGCLFGKFEKVNSQYGKVVMVVCRGGRSI